MEFSSSRSMGAIPIVTGNLVLWSGSSFTDITVNTFKSPLACLSDKVHRTKYLVYYTSEDYN
jgi:hypothetical protein